MRASHSSPVLTACTLASTWPNLALAVKRLHDRGRSGWFCLVGVIPFVNIWLTIDLLFLRGTEGPNRFGEDPLGVRDDAARPDDPRRSES